MTRSEWGKREKGKKPKQTVKQGGEKDGAVKSTLGPS